MFWGACTYLTGSAVDYFDLGRQGSGQLRNECFLPDPNLWSFLGMLLHRQPRYLVMGGWRRFTGHRPHR